MKTLAIVLCFAWLLYGSAAASESAGQDKRPVHAALAAVGANDTTKSQQNKAQLEQVAEVPVYVPPRRGAPRTRVGGGTRSADATKDEVLLVLAPPHTGLTQQAQPTLYWFLSADDPGPFEFVLIGSDAVAPLWRARVDGPLTAGIHAIALDDAGVTLEPGVEYQWSVAIVRDEARRSRDLVASGTVLRTAATAAMDDHTNPIFALAADGLWYDAIEALGHEIAADADNRTLRGYRHALFEQADLAQVNDYLDAPRPVADPHPW